MKIFKEIKWWYHAGASSLLTLFAHYMSSISSFLIRLGVASLERSKHHVDQL